MRRWQLMQHVSNIYDILPCSDRCHETMTTNGAGFILKGYITMLWPLSWDDDNWRSMFHTWMIYNHSLTVVMRRWQLMEHDSYQRYILPCSDRCLETMTTDGACFIPEEYITMLWPLSLVDDNLQGMFNRYMKMTMLWPLSSDDDNWRSMTHTWLIYYHALTVVMRQWKLKEHVANLSYE